MTDSVDTENATGDYNKYEKFDRVTALFDDDEWVKRLETEGRAFNFPDADMGDLDNEVHPIFATLTEQPGFMPALRLASMHIHDRQLLPFWHAILCRDRTVLPVESAAFETTIHGLSRKPTPLSNREVGQTRAALLNVAPHVQFLFHRVDTQEPEYAHTRRVLAEDPHFGHLSENAPGNGSVIILHYGFAHALSREADAAVSGEERLRISLFVARTILHELAHAIVHYRFPMTIEIIGTDQTPEPFFEDFFEAEIGWAMEICLFGGDTRILRSGNDFNMRYGLAVRKCASWPSDNDWAKSTGTRMFPKGIVLFARDHYRHSRWHTDYVLPMQLIQDMFTKAFWNEQVKARGAKALQIEKGPDDTFFGIREPNPDWDPDDEDNWSVDSSVDLGADDDGFVTPATRLDHAGYEYIFYTTRPDPPPVPQPSDLRPAMGDVISPLTDELQRSIKYYNDGNVLNPAADSSATWATDPQRIQDGQVAIPPVYPKIIEGQVRADPKRTKLLDLDPLFYR